MNRMLVFGAVLCMGAKVFSAEYVIEAPNGVGDVVALTNAFKKSHYASSAATILLEPGVYDLSGIKMDGSRHLLCYGLKKSSLIAGLGDEPGDTILLGGGEEDNCRVMDLYGGDVTVSNLTITGGYLSGSSDGAGINGGPNVSYRYLIVSNNYAKGSGGGGGGGCIKGKAYNCLFVDNRTGKYGAAFYVDSDGCGAWDCVFSNNVSSSSGGAFFATANCNGANLSGCDFLCNSGGKGAGAYVGHSATVRDCLFKYNRYNGANGYDNRGGGLHLVGGECIDCRFVGNSADGGGGLYVGSSTVRVNGCTFEGNLQTGWGNGSAAFVNSSSPLAVFSNCVFNANIATNYSGRTIVSNAELVDCVVTNHNLYGAVLQNCNMIRCLVADNVSTVGSGVDLDDVKTEDIGYMTRTNVNCIFIGNHLTETTVTTGDKIVINCTYYSNRMDSSNFGVPVANCKVWNSLFAENVIAGVKRDMRRFDHRGDVLQRYLTNCVFKTVSADFQLDADGYGGCKIAPNFRFTHTEDGGKYDVKSTSPAFNAGIVEDWMVPFFSGMDFARRNRVMFGAIDVGALECQYFPGFIMVIR